MYTIDFQLILGTSRIAFSFHCYTIGKSTLLSLIAGLLEPEKGLIKINGKYLKESTTNVGYMLQHDELFEWRTIYNNVILGLEVQHMLTARTKAKAHDLLDMYGLKKFENSRPSELSGGMRQRAALILDPYLVVLNSLPKSALAPLLIVWLGANTTTIIVAGMSVAIFGSILNLYASFTTVDPGKIKLIYTLQGHKLQALTKVVLPSSLPAIISNMKVNIGLCLVGVIIGEFLAARNGLGYLIIYSSQVFKMDWLLMSIVLLCVMATILYSLINLLERWCLHRF